jgi:hypothetical protein
MKTKEEILKEAEIEWGLRVGPKSNQREQTRVLLSILSKALAQTREETIREEIAYWTDVFDNRPKNRDLESDNIAQNFARIEIERLENKLKK